MTSLTPEPHGHASTHGQVLETALASGQRLLEPVTVTALFDDPARVERALDALYTAGMPRDLIEVVVSGDAAERFYARLPGGQAPRPPGRETWRFAGIGALAGFVSGVVISLVMVAWPGIDAPGGNALVQVAGPNIGTIAGAAAGAVVGSLRRQRPKARHARAAEASSAIVFAVAARSDEEAALIGQLLTTQGGREVRLEGPGD
ncbi:MAG: hypothetical protein ACYC2G_11035 [Gemmatimonadaceae bacterium]